MGEQGEGFLRKVTKATVIGNTITLQTTQASLADVFKEGDFSFNLNMSGMQQSTKTGLNKKTLAGETIDGGFNFTIPSTNIYSAGALSIDLKGGQVSFNPNWFFDFKFDGLSGFKYFELSAQNATLNGSFTAAVTAEQAIMLAKSSKSILPNRKPYTKTFTYWIPTTPLPLPIKVVMSIDLFLDYEAQISAKITREATFTTNNTFNFGIKYLNSQWENINSLTPVNTFTLNNSTGNANASINLALTPKISFKLMGVAGPYASVSLMQQLSGSVASPALDWHTKADVWLKTTIGASASILSYKLPDYNVPFESSKLSYETPFKIEKVAGDAQTGEANKALANPIKVKVVDNLNKPQANVPVYFTVLNGGQVSTQNIMTDANGFAETNWTLGTNPTQTLNVSVKKPDGSAINNSPVSFTAMATSSEVSIVGKWEVVKFERKIYDKTGVLISTENTSGAKGVEFKSDGTFITNTIPIENYLFGNYTISADNKLLTIDKKNDDSKGTEIIGIQSLTSSEFITYNEYESGGTVYYENGTIIKTITGIHKETTTFRKVLSALPRGM